MPHLKQPAERLIYEFDFSPRLGTQAIASIVSATVTPRGRVPEVAAFSIGAQAFAGQAARLRLDGGTDGESYLITLTVTDDTGQTHEIDAEFAVVDFGFEVPTLVSPYLSAQQFVDRMGLDDTVRITDITGNGRIDAPRLTNALADAQAETDGYLAGLYAVPLAAVPALIAAIVFDLAVARLWTGELPASVRERRDSAQRQLRDIAKRVIVLPDAAALAQAEISAAPVLLVGGDRLFSRETLKGF